MKFGRKWVQVFAYIYASSIDMRPSTRPSTRLLRLFTAKQVYIACSVQCSRKLGMTAPCNSVCVEAWSAYRLVSGDGDGGMIAKVFEHGKYYAYIKEHILFSRVHIFLLSISAYKMLKKCKTMCILTINLTRRIKKDASRVKLVIFRCQNAVFCIIYKYTSK